MSIVGFANVSQAYTGYNQLNNTTYSNSTAVGTQTYILQLGNGLSGSVMDTNTVLIGLKRQVTATTTEGVYLEIEECTTNPTTDVSAFAPTFCTNKWQGTGSLSLGDTVAGDYFVGETIGTGLGFNFDPTKYYALFVQVTSPRITGGSTNLQLSGISTGSTYCNGWTSSPGSSCGTVKQGKYSIGVTDATITTPTLSNLQPANASTTASTAVTLSFNYNYTGTDLQSYAFHLTDISVGIFATTSTFIYTGTPSGGTVSKLVTLLQNHVYSLSAQLCTTSGTCYSGIPANNFSVIADYKSTYADLFTGYGALISSTTLQTCSRPDSLLDVGGGITYGFCTMFIPSQNILNQFSSIPSRVAERFPFNYINGLTEVFNAVSSQSATSTPTVEIPNFLGIGDLELINLQTAVASSSGMITTARNMFGYMIYFIFGIFAFTKVSKLI